MNDVAIVGGGIVGLSTAYQILTERPQTKLILLEKESQVGQHQTGHNSGVIHSGIYYKAGSLKAQNCINGYQMLIDFAKKNDIPYDLCGKLIVATNEKEKEQIQLLLKRGQENNLDGLRILNREEIKEIEPFVEGLEAIHVPQTGIIDYGLVCQKLKENIEKQGAKVKTGFPVQNLFENEKGVIIHSSKRSQIEAKIAINCGGLFSDRLAKGSLKKIDTKIIPFRGEYFKLKETSKYLVKNLIYPVPDPNFPFLGVHFTRMINGDVEAGPNAVLAFKREGYKKTDFNVFDLFEILSWPGFQKVALKYWQTGLGELYRSYSKKAFTRALQKLVPSIKKSDLEAAPAGVRAQASSKDGGLLDDFKIEQKNKIIHVLNAPSPAATSSLSIGRTIAELALQKI
ncbi:MAG: L-2-hydroxyglutarate oxidase [Bacteroidota bacterium]|nr:L-2-hydroxyglutarate oxidase [Bacteroidota bacterium]